MPKWQRGNFWQKAEMERSMEENVNDNTELQEEPDIFYGGYKERMEAIQALLHLSCPCQSLFC